MAELSFSRRTGSERDIQPVAIVAVDASTRTATGVTRTRHSIQINCAYATGDTITIPASGEQWYVERFDMEWRLYGRIPFNDATLNIAPEEGQVSVGSASGPLELNGTEVRANGETLRLNGVYFRDTGEQFERSTDKINWTPVAAGLAGLVELIANALTGYEGVSQTDAVQALKDWASLIQEILDSFWLFWTQMCENIFVNGLKRLGVGETDLEKIVNGLQNFVNYAFSLIFCDFTGDLTPQTFLARLRDLLAPLKDNPIILGFQAIAQILELSVGNLLNDAVAGATGFLELLFNIITCNWEDIDLAWIEGIIGLVGEDTPFAPANIFKFIVGLIEPLMTNPFALGLMAIAEALGKEVSGLLDGAITGGMEFIRFLFDLLLCQVDPDELTAVLGIAGSTFSPAFIAKAINDFFQFFRDNPFLTGLQDFLGLVGETTGNLLQDAVAGVTEFVSLVVGVIFCDPDKLEQLGDLVDGILPGIGDPLGILRLIYEKIISPILNNPLVMLIKGFAETVLGIGGGLLNQVLVGSGDLINWVLKIIKTIIPLGTGAWAALLPFVDWDAVDEADVNFPDLGTALAGFDPFDLFVPLQQFFSNITSLLGLDFLDEDFNPLTAVSDFLTHITTDLSGWIQTNVIGPIVTAILGSGFTSLANITTFFNRLRQIFNGFNFMGGSFNPIDAVRALLELFFNPDKVPQLDDDDELPVSTIKGIADFANSNIIRPIVTTLLLGSGLDLTKFGINTQEDLDNVDIGVLGDLAGSLLTSLGNIPADLLTGLIPPAIMGVVPVANISDTSPNLLLQGAFLDAISVEDNDNWFWDSTTNMAGSVGGSAKTVISPAKNRYLYSRQTIPVAVGDRIRLNGFVKTTGLTVSPGGSTPISISLIPFIRNSSGATEAQTPVVIGTQLGSSTSWTNVGQSSTTHYEVTNASWVYVVVRLGVASTATAGTVWWDAISLKKVGLLTQGNVDSLLATWEQSWTTIFGTSGAGKNWSHFVAALSQLNWTAGQGVEKGDGANGNVVGVIDSIGKSIFGDAYSYNSPGQVKTAMQHFINKLFGVNTVQTELQTAVIPPLDASSIDRGTLDIGRIPTDDVGATINPGAGSGALLIRSSDEPVAPRTQNSRNLAPDGFFTKLQVSSTDISCLRTNGSVGTGERNDYAGAFKVSNAGWYMVELSTRINMGFANGAFSCAPVLYKGTTLGGTTAFKIGTDSHTIVTSLAPFYVQVQHRFVQNSWIVYLNANDIVRAGFDTAYAGAASSGLGGESGTGTSGVETYFSISLLNKSFA